MRCSRGRGGGGSLLFLICKYLSPFSFLPPSPSSDKKQPSNKAHLKKMFLSNSQLGRKIKFILAKQSGTKFIQSIKHLRYTYQFRLLSGKSQVAVRELAATLPIAGDLLRLRLLVRVLEMGGRAVVFCSLLFCFVNSHFGGAFD